MNIFLEPDDLWVFSITVTGKCNANCSYCHFYAERDRKEYLRDISDELFDNYINLINYIKEKYHKNLQVRFSGGEPLMLGERLFELSNRVYERTGIEPYILTNGKYLTQEVIDKSRTSHISSFLVSIENPFDQAKGAPRTNETLQKIKELDCEEVRVLPAIMIFKNSMFKYMYTIADYIYNEIGILPSFAELTFQAFESPTNEELNDLHENIKKIAKNFYKKAPIRIFPYVSPELYANGQKNYVTELDIDNIIRVNSNNIEDVSLKLFSKLSKSYKSNPCTKEDCDWYQDCKIIKWLWFQPVNNITTEQKLNDYCRMKKVINRALYEGIMDSKNV